MRLIFIRHGEPDYSIDSLTEKGWREAELLGRRVAQWDVTGFYRSPLGRAGDTAKPAMGLTGRSPETLEWLREFPGTILDETGARRIAWDLFPGDWTKDGAMYDKDTWGKSEIYLGSDVDEVQERVSRELDGFLAAHGYERTGNYYTPVKSNDDTLVFFCHLGIICVLLGHLLGISAPALWHGLFLPPSSVTVLTTEERREGEAYFRVQMLGDTSHLRFGGEPVSHMGGYGVPFQG